MEVSLTAGAAPVFLSGNYLTRHADRAGDLAVSSGSALRHRLYDMDRFGPWAGTNDDDGVDETITFGLWQPGFQGSRDVDFLAVLGHNLVAFDVDLSDDNGASFPGANQQVFAGLSADYSLRSLAAPIPADKLRYTLHGTSPEDQFKEVGAIVVANATLQMPIGMSTFKRLPKRVKTREARMHDNSVRRSYIYRSDASYHFNDFSVGFVGLTEDEADAIEAILLRSAEPFIFFPEPGDRPRDMYLGQVTPGTYMRDYINKAKSGGEFVTFDFEEIGGA